VLAVAVAALQHVVVTQFRHQGSVEAEPNVDVVVVVVGNG